MGAKKTIEVDSQVPLHPPKTLLDLIRDKENIPSEITLKYAGKPGGETAGDLTGRVYIKKVVNLPPETPPPGLAGGGKKKI